MGEVVLEEGMMSRTRTTLLLLLVSILGHRLAMAQSRPEFSLALSPAVVTLPQGSITSFSLTFDSNERPSYTVTVAGLPDGVQAQVPPVRSGNGAVILYANPDATVGTFAVQVTAKAGNNAQTQILTLNIKPMQPAPQWEYTMIAASSDEEFIAYANRLGDQGWELVSVKAPEGSALVGFFKRIKR
jgi:hypothetical protein